MVMLSIVIPYYKTYDLTKKLLEELTKQLTEETEVFLVDDGCHEERLDAFKNKINVYHLEKNSGATIAMNYAIKQAKGKYIAIIDSDDMIDKEYIKTLLKTIKDRDEDVIYFDWQDMHSGVIVHHPHNYAPWKAIYKKSIMPLFREGWFYSYDVPFQDDLSKIRHTEYYIDKVLYYYNSDRIGNLTWKKEQMRRKKMIKVEAVKDFTLERFNEIKNIVRKKYDVEGKLFAGDVFECSKELADYLYGGNDKKQIVIKIIEVIPEPLDPIKQDENPNDFFKEIDNINEKTKVITELTKEISKPKKPKIKKNK